MESQSVSINFGRGIDTKADPKLAISTKLLELQNAVFTQGGQLRKRNGYDSMSLDIVGGGVISSPTMIQSYRNELICAGMNSSSDRRLYSYSPDLDAWNDCGKYWSVEVSKSEIAQFDYPVSPSGVFTVGGTLIPTCAVSGNFALFAYSQQTNAVSYFSVRDTSTGKTLVESQSLGLVSNPKAILLGSSTLAIIYAAFSTQFLTLVTISITSGGGVVVGSPVTLESSVAFPVYDAVNTPGGAAIVYLNGTTLELLTINTSGATVNTASISSAGSDITVVHINSDSVGNVWLYWAKGAAGSVQLMYAVYSSTLGSVLSATNIGSASISALSCLSALPVSATSQTLYYSTYSSILIGGAQAYSTTISQVVVTTSIPGSATTFLLNADIYSRPISFQGRNMMAVIFASYTSSTGILIDLADATAIAKFLPGESEYLFSVINNGNGFPHTRSGFALNSLIPLSSSDLYFCANSIVTLTTIANTSSGGLSAQPISSILGTVALSFDFNSIDAYQSLIQQDTLVMNGGVVSQYDSSQVSELGFTVDPEAWVVTPSSSGGVLGTGQWLYYITYEWIDSLGNLHQSAPSISYVVKFASGTTNSVTVECPSLQLSQKSGVWVVLWRTQNGGTIAYRVSGQANLVSGSMISLLDIATTDADLIIQPELYTAGGSILENIAPPPAMVMWQKNNRPWLVDSENPETNIEYAKTGSPGTGISFSTGQLELVIDSQGGKITGASGMDEKTVILKKNGVCYFYGDGSTDAGTGSSISNILFIPSDAGCENSKSVILYPNGIIFKSPKGIYLVSRGVQVSYFGTDVEAFNSQSVLSASIMQGTTQIRFLTDSGSSLVYDYLYNQWGTFTNHSGISSTIWNGLYVYVRSDGSIYKENDTSFLDDTSSFAVLIQTSWIKANTIQNFQRVWEFELLGDYSCASNDTTYGVQMSFAYDFVSIFIPSNVIPFSPSGGVTTTFQERIFPSQQKCDAIQIQIAELPTGASGEYIDFSDLDMQIAVKKGLNKLSPFKSTG